jgi:hypothetical protein
MEITPEILELLNCQDKDDTFGPELITSVALRMNGILEQKTNKETMEKLKTKLLIPENCKFLNVPKVNPELWSQLPPRSKANDAKMQYVQQFGSKSLTAFALIANEVAKSAKVIPKNVSESLLKFCLDGASAAAMQHRESNVKRMQAIKPLLSSQFAGICSTPVTGSYLFGDNLNEALKTSKTVTNILKRGTNYRFTPYSTQRGTTQSLNYRGQFRPFNRGGQRSRPNYFRQRFQTNPRQNYQPQQ